MIDLIIVPRNTSLRAQRSWASKICLPFTDCPEPHSYEPDCECKNNANFHWPVQDAETIMLQSNMIDPYNSPGSFTTGWSLAAPGTYSFKLEIVNCSGSVVSGPVTDFANNYVVGYDGSSYYQTIELDFSKPFFAALEDVFQVRIVDLGGSGNKTYFPPMRKDACLKAVEIQSTLSTKDCIGRFYGKADAGNFFGSGNFNFDNWRRLEGNIEVNQFPIESDTTDTGQVTTKTNSRVARLRLEDMPEYMARELTSIFLGSDVNFNDVYYDTIPGLVKDNDESEMWHIDIEVSRVECEFGKECD